MGEWMYGEKGECGVNVCMARGVSACMARGVVG